jgi:4-amino-4-deoxy-L-arabinose transferase-like glycosyltransferase
MRLLGVFRRVTPPITIAPNCLKNHKAPESGDSGAESGGYDSVAPRMMTHWSRGWRPYALLGLLCLGLYLPGISSLPVTDRDEARFAQASRQMVETGDWVRVRFRDEARNKKPAGIYWLQALAVESVSDASSDTIWPYRVPSFLGALAAVLLTFALGRNLVGGPAALLGAALMASSLELAVEAHLAKTDAVLLACVAAAQLALGEIYRRARAGDPAPWPWALLFWASLGAGALIKGPVLPLLAVLTCFALAASDREALWLKDLRPLWGAPLFALIVVPWLAAISLATGGAFVRDSLGHDFFAKIVGVQEGHGAPPGSYLIALALTFWPGSLFLDSGLTRAWAERDRPSQRFLLVWIVPFWAALELIPTKLPHYALPIYPALALLVAHALFNAVPRPFWMRAATALCWSAATLALAAALGLGPAMLGKSAVPAGVAAAAALLVGGFALLAYAWRQASPSRAVGAALLALAIYAPGFRDVAPALDRIWISRDAAALAHAKAPGAPVDLVGYSEPSLVFLLGTGTRIDTPDAAARYLESTPGAAALVEGHADEEFRAALARLGAAAAARGTVAGLDYSNGKRTRLTLYAAPR